MTDEDEMLATAVSAVNGLTKRWMETFDDHQDIIGSGLGVCAVLAPLLVGAHGSARDELSVALGVSQDEAPAVAAVLASLVGSEDALHMATGLWARPSVSVLESFIEACGFATIGEIPDPSVLDAWASEHTNGLIDSFPFTPTPDTLLLLASAVAAELEWKHPFEPFSSPWGDETEDFVTMLATSTADIDQAAIIGSGDHAVGRFCCASTSSIDVHLISGQVEDSPGAVLGLGIDALNDPSLVRTGSELSIGESAGALQVRELPGTDEMLNIELPAFSLQQSHDLLRSPDLWGLQSASDATRGHFDGIADEPLAVEAAVQDALVEFHALGFKAAAVTAVAVAAGAAPQVVEERCRTFDFTLDRPFGFIAVHRDSGLVLFSGWVATPAALKPEQERNWMTGAILEGAPT